MNYEIKRDDETVFTGVITGNQSRKAMGEDVLETQFSLPYALDLHLGDKLTAFGQTYKLNRAANITKTGERNYQYEAQWEALFYDLAKVQFRGLGATNQLTESEFTIMANAATMVDLIVRNANRLYVGWEIGVVDDTELQNFTISGQNCLQVLNTLADAYGLEFWIDNQVIHFTRREQSSGIVLSYGKDNGLYEVYRGRKNDADLVTRLYVEGGSRNLPSGYGKTRLQLPEGNYLEAPEAFEIIEATQIFENIIPERVGTVTAVNADDIFEFTDNTLDFDINAQLMPVVKAKVGFQTGALAGYEFEIDSYDNASKIFKIVLKTDEKAYPDGLPNDVLKPAVGDKYALFDIELPESYVTDAQNRLAAAGQAYLDKYSRVQYEYGAKLTPIWVKQTLPNVVLGYTVRLIDEPLGIDKEIRIGGYARDLQAVYTYELELTDTISVSEIVRQYAQQERILYAIQTAGLLDPEQMRKNLFLNRLSESNGYLYLGADKIKAGFADYAQEAGFAQTANYALLAEHAYTADQATYALDSDKWDGMQFADYINQPVRTGDSPRFAGTGSPTFFSGFAGSGWRIENVNGNVSATFDNLTVRKEMNVYELIINQIRATNGSLWVSDSIKILGVSVSGSNYVCTIDTDNNSIAIPFFEDDLIRCQKWTGRNVKYYTARVITIGNGTFTITVTDGSGIPAANDEVVRVGNTTNTARQNAIYLTASDENNPYIDILSGVNSASFEGKTVARLGNLSGITSPIWGALIGNGIWTNRGYFENVYVSGEVNVTGGNAATQTYVQAAATTAKNEAIATVAPDVQAAQTAANDAYLQALQANNQLADIASDGKLTPAEKKATKTIWDSIVQEREKILAQAGQYGVSTSAYTAAFNSLNSYISPLLSNLNTTSDITRSTFQTRFSDYYDAREALLQAIVTATKTYTNTQITDAKDYADQVAQSQAQVAQAAAIQAASTDATNKANSARTQAESYSQQLVNSINLGTVNILSGNTALTTLSGWTVNIGGTTIVSDSGRQVVQITGSTPGMGIFRSTGALLDVGKEYTIGIDIKSTASTSSVNFGTHNTGSRIISVPSSSGWARYYYTFVATNTTVSIICYINGTQPATFLVRNVKLEIGNKGTDWSPNPAETQASIDAAQSAANSAQQAYNTLTSQLKGMAYKDVVQLADLGTTVISNGKIVTTLIDAAWIQANVVNAGYLSSVTFSLNSGTINNLVGNNAFINSLTANTGFINNLTANNAFMQSVVVGGGGATVSDLNNMQVGGRNQALSTAAPLTFTGTGVNNETVVSYYYNASVAGRKITVSFDWQVAQNASFPSNGIFRFQNNGTPDFATFSEVITPYAQGRSGNSKYTFTAPSYTGSATTLRLRLRSDYITGLITITNFKVEIGDKATDWTPAPEDVSADATAKANAARDSAIADANAKIGPLPSGQTIIATVGGVAYVKTDLINVAQIFAQNVTASGNITATNFNLNSGKMGFMNVEPNRIYIGNKDTWVANSDVISILQSQVILRRNGSVSGQTAEFIYYPYAITGTLETQATAIKNNITAGTASTNVSLALQASGAQNNYALKIESGGVWVNGYAGQTTNIDAGGARLRFVNGIYCGTWN